MRETYAVKPLTAMRKAIAARMSEASQTIPHYRLGADIEVDALLELREEFRARDPETKVSLNDFLIKACAAALMDVPAMNVRWAETAIHEYRCADVSVVTAVEGGLLTPIVRSAESKSVSTISRETTDLLSRAARNALRMEEILGGTFSISNLGMHDVEQFDAIINPPQCAILAVGSAKHRALVSPRREIRIATLMHVTLSVDHRAVDGATAASFMAALRRRLEQPEYMREIREDASHL
jgi:pyruvate dehydrogenase E2 component (dihydrolipoamide acetyltransferase)